jgi:hypothetical protein
VRDAEALDDLPEAHLAIDRFAQVRSDGRDPLIRVGKDFQMHELAFETQPWKATREYSSANAIVEGSIE